MTDQQLPQDIKAEESVIGALLVSEPALKRVIDDVGLGQGDFYLDRHQTIYGAIAGLYGADKPCDELTVNDALGRQGNTDKAGGKDYVSELAANVPDPGNVRHYAEIVQRHARGRSVIKAAQTVIAKTIGDNLNGEIGHLVNVLQHPGTYSPAGSLQVIRGSDIPMRRVDFLDAAGMIPTGSVTVLLGSAGLGKTTYALSICADATAGTLEGLSGPRNVLVSSQEDDPPAVLLPRLAAAGADLDRVYIVKGLTIPTQVDALVRQAKQVDAALVLVDPLGAHLDGKVDSHKEAAIRGALAPLAEMAADLKLAAMVIAHPNKTQGQTGLNRISGSGGLGNAARSVIVFGTDPADPDGDAGSGRVIAHLKNNVGKLAPSLTARIETTEVPTEDGPATVPCLRITGTSAQCADDILSSPTTEERGARAEAREFLLDLLGDGPVRSKEIKGKHVQNAGLSLATVRRAKDDLNIVADQKADGWYWALPDEGGK